MVFLTRITYFGVTTYHFDSLEKLEAKLINDCKIEPTHNDKETLSQWQRFKSDCVESKKDKGYFIFHAISDDETIAIITG